MRGPGSLSCHPRIKWAQAHGTREALERRFRLAGGSAKGYRFKARLYHPSDLRFSVGTTVM
jgi:hypothetical protein